MPCWSCKYIMIPKCWPNEQNINKNKRYVQNVSSKTKILIKEIKIIIIYISSQDLWWTIQANLFLKIAPQPKQRTELSVTAFDVLEPSKISRKISSMTACFFYIFHWQNLPVSQQFVYNYTTKQNEQYVPVLFKLN